MKKKEIIQIQFSSAREVNDSFNLLDEPEQVYIVTSKVMICEHHKMLLLDFYNQQELAVRGVYSKSGDYWYYNYREKKISKASFERTILGPYHKRMSVVFCDQKVKERIYKFFKEDNQERKLEYVLYDYEQIRIQKNRLKREKNKAKIVKQWNEKIVLPLPRNIRKKAHDDAKHYVLVDGSECYCTHCGCTYESSKKMKHLSETVCEKCGAPVIVQQKKRGKKYLEDISWRVIPQPLKNGEGIVMRYVMFLRSISNLDKNKIETRIEECARTFICGDGYFYLEKPGRKWIISTATYHTPYVFWSPKKLYCGYAKLDPAYMERIAQEISAFRYLPLEIFQMMNGKKGIWEQAVATLYNEERNQRKYAAFLEKLYKCRLNQICREVMQHLISLYYYYPYEIDWDETEILKMLKLDKNGYQMLLKEDSLDNLKILQHYSFASYGDFQMWKRYMDTRINMKDFGFSNMKILKYLLKQTTEKEFMQEKDKIANLWSMWESYMELVEKVEFRDPYNEKGAFPKNLLEAKKEVEQIWKDMQEQIAIEKEAYYAETCEKIASAMRSEKDFQRFFEGSMGLKVIIPQSIKELKMEGIRMGNCLGSYGDRIMRGQTSIFFIRKLNNPDKEYFAMEYRDGKIIQLEGKSHSHDLQGVVTAFANMFCNALNAAQWQPSKMIAA